MVNRDDFTKQRENRRFQRNWLTFDVYKLAIYTHHKCVGIVVVGVEVAFALRNSKRTKERWVFAVLWWSPIWVNILIATATAAATQEQQQVRVLVDQRGGACAFVDGSYFLANRTADWGPTVCGSPKWLFCPQLLPHTGRLDWLRVTEDPEGSKWFVSPLQPYIHTAPVVGSFLPSTRWTLTTASRHSATATQIVR